MIEHVTFERVRIDQIISRNTYPFKPFRVKLKDKGIVLEEVAIRGNKPRGSIRFSSSIFNKCKFVYACDTCKHERCIRSKREIRRCFF